MEKSQGVVSLWRTMTGWFKYLWRKVTRVVSLSVEKSHGMVVCGHHSGHGLSVDII